MQSGGYNKQSQEDKALEAGKLGMSSTIKHLSKANSGFAIEKLSGLANPD